jgi:hypothetical protein
MHEQGQHLDLIESGFHPMIQTVLADNVRLGPVGIDK